MSDTYDTAEIQAQEQSHIPGDPAIWLLISGDFLIFCLFFATFAYYRRESLVLFQQSRLQLNQSFGVTNTVLMLTSSWFVASAVRLARMKDPDRASLCFALGVCCGIGFVCIKAAEYAEKTRAGISPLTNDFFMYYFVFTAIHLLHVIVGIGILLALARYVRRGAISAKKLRNIETGATFWHLTDLLWIILFALLYLLP